MTNILISKQQRDVWDQITRWDTHEAWKEVIGNTATATYKLLVEEQDLTPEQVITFSQERLLEIVKTVPNQGTKSRLIQFRTYLIERAEEEELQKQIRRAKILQEAGATPQ